MSAADYVRRYYGVPAKRGMRVIADGHPGTITGYTRAGAYLRVRLDGERRSDSWHPTWRMDYLGPNGELLFEGEGKPVSRIPLVEGLTMCGCGRGPVEPAGISCEACGDEFVDDDYRHKVNEGSR